jgi:hypothetical protein
VAKDQPFDLPNQDDLLQDLLAAFPRQIDWCDSDAEKRFRDHVEYAYPQLRQTVVEQSWRAFFSEFANLLLLVGGCIYTTDPEIVARYLFRAVPKLLARFGQVVSARPPSQDFLQDSFTTLFRTQSEYRLGRYFLEHWSHRDP